MFLLTQLSLLTLSNVLLAVVGLAATVTARPLVQRHWLLATLCAYLALNLSIFLNVSYYEAGNAVFYYLEYPSVLLLTYCTFELAMSVAGVRHRWAPWAFRGTVLLATVPWASGLVTAIRDRVPLYGDEFTVLLILPIALIIANAAFLGWRLYRLTGSLPVNVLALWRMRPAMSSRQRAVLGLFVTLLLCFLGAICLLVMRVSFVEREIFLSTFFLFNTLIISGLVLTYLYHVDQRLDLANRITSTLLLLFLTVFALSSVWLYGHEHDRPRAYAGLLDERSLTFTARSEQLYEVRLDNLDWRDAPAARLKQDGHGAIVLDLPFSFPFYGERYRRLAIFPMGFVVPLGAGRQAPAVGQPGLQETICFDKGPAVIPFCSGGPAYDIYVDTAAGHATVTWLQAAGGDGRLPQPVSQLVLARSGDITFSYRRFPEESAAIWNNVLGITNGDEARADPVVFDELPAMLSAQPIWFDLTLLQRLAIHDVYLPFAVLIVLLVALSLIGFRWFLVRTLVAPLDQIRAGLAAVDEGRLDVEVKLTRPDEFGDLADGFNGMIDGLREARQRAEEATELLEAELAERTMAAVDGSARPLLSKDEVFEQRMREVIAEKLGDFDFQIADLADEMGVSTRQLHRKVVTVTAQTPSALIRAMRLARADELLRARAANVSEAAYKTGFKDVSHFSKLYQKKFGRLPSEAAH